MTISVNDSVVMKASVIKRTHHSDFAKNFKGVVVKVCGNTADVDTPHGIRSVPVANITALKKVQDSRTGISSTLIIE